MMMMMMTPAHQHYLIVTLLLSLIATIKSHPIEDDGTSTIAAPTYYNNDNHQRPRSNPERRGRKRKLIIEKEEEDDDMSIYDITPFPTPSPPPPSPPSSLPTPPGEVILNMIPSPTYFPLPTHLPTSLTAAIIDGDIDDKMMIMTTPTQTTPITSETNNNQEYYESMLNAIDNWCIVPNGSKTSSYNNNNNSICQCPNPLIPTGRYLTNGWYEQFLHNVNIAQQIAAATATASNTYSSTSSSNNNNNNNNNAQQQLLDIVFMGDSITEQRQGTRRGTIVPSYTPIKAAFEQTFQLSSPLARATIKSNENQTAVTKKYNAIALGIQGDTTTNLQWRIQHAKYLTTLTPKIWWIGIGTNNILKYSCSEDVIVLGIRHIVEEILRVQKKKKKNDDDDDDVIVVINSLLPVQNNGEGLLSLELDDDEETTNIKEAAVKSNNVTNSTNSTNNTNKETRGDNECNRTLCYNTYPHIHSINTKLRQYAMNTPNVHYFNADSIFIEERDAVEVDVTSSLANNGNGEVKKKQKYMKLELFDDPVHPNLRGHEEWNKMILKHLYYLLG